MMFQQSLALLGVIAAVSVGVIEGGVCKNYVSWGVTQSAGGTCPSSINIGPGDVIGSYAGNGHSPSCSSSVIAGPSSCTPSTTVLDDDEGRRRGRRLSSDGCIQCSGADDDDDDAVINLDDDQGDDQGDDHSDDDDQRRLSSVRAVTTTEDSDQLGAIVTYTITAEFDEGEDPIALMTDIENQIVLFFANADNNAGALWLARARELGVDLPEGTQVTFSEPAVDDDSVQVTKPSDFIDHHYHGNSNVRIGTWIGAGLACMGVMVSAKYGLKAYKLKHEADVIEQKKATEWANVEETAGELTLNPLAGGCRQRSTSSEGTA